MNVTPVADYGWCHVCGRYATRPIDGTNRWLCSDCMALALRAAEATLRPDREYHRNHDVKYVGCPYCYPGAIA